MRNLRYYYAFIPLPIEAIFVILFLNPYHYENHVFNIVKLNNKIVQTCVSCAKGITKLFLMNLRKVFLFLILSHHELDDIGMSYFALASI